MLTLYSPLAVQEVAGAVERVDEKEEVARQDARSRSPRRRRAPRGQASARRRRISSSAARSARRRRAAVGFDPDARGRCSKPCSRRPASSAMSPRPSAISSRASSSSLMRFPVRCARRPILDRFRKSSMPAIRERPFTGFGPEPTRAALDSPSEALSEPLDGQPSPSIRSISPRCCARASATT